VRRRCFDLRLARWPFAKGSGTLTCRLRIARGGVSHSLLSALVSVAKHGPIRPADLAQVGLVSAPSITPKLDQDHVRIVRTFREPRVARGQGDTGAGVDRELSHRCRVATVISPVNFETSSGVSVITASNMSS
jgi:hypothetical protein